MVLFVCALKSSTATDLNSQLVLKAIEDVMQIRHPKYCGYIEQDYCPEVVSANSSALRNVGTMVKILLRM